jgi:16S rRNA (guanine(966)-N(2))-methyltransferase RsmD
MRIISGLYKGKRLTAPNNLPVRPTTDFGKEALFNIISNNYNIEDLTVLDLFSGTGNISYEFASRGAKEITCIDLSFHCVNYIKKTCKQLQFNQVSAYKNDVFKYLKKYPNKFDIIFADPPYDLPNIDEIVELVLKNELLNPDGLLIVEHDRNWDFSEHDNFFKHRKCGNVNFSLFEL